jgi:hypothetical protein
MARPIMRRRQVMLLSFLITLDLAQRSPPTPTPATSRRLRRRLPAPPLDDPAFTDCLGYQGQIYEDRHGVYNLTIHTTGSMVGVTHVEGDVTANQAAALKATSVFLAANSSSKLSQRPLSSPICTRHNTRHNT